ncbi:MAG: OmpA family protein [Reichenbachiella sp.]|uniref:OmpA family protein n=1 Tax=Reichenbachiella sp. TaxID=2184521 RepID=UPI0032669A5D
MNLNLTLGALLFILWSSFSSWYYVCKIKGLCLEDVTDPQKEVVDIPTKDPEPDPDLKADPEPEPVVMDTVSQEPVKPLAPIEINEDKIYFKKNSTSFVDEKYVERFSENLKSTIADRSVEISIIGATCDLGSQSYNLELGERRAAAMRQYLENRDIRPSRYEVSSVGESEAVAGTEEIRKSFRRVSITIKSIDQ